MPLPRCVVYFSVRIHAEIVTMTSDGAHNFGSETFQVSSPLPLPQALIISNTYSEGGKQDFETQSKTALEVHDDVTDTHRQRKLAPDVITTHYPLSLDY